MRRRIFVTRGSQALLFFLAYSLIFPVHIFALPQGGQVAAGSAQISQLPSGLRSRDPARRRASKRSVPSVR